ncbi:hypothetical protein SAMN05216421_1713 [Halopseudomonas xinjiangensis]|uniref:Uncharacterized protein n=1 Tax=Halopseudomonas xinjiangensis TaxID=487184 RepID=A0A1H1T1Y2_9GAMM|nr:hypothetical protein SAMN05216421_1713 [Halopseudomonas xinjiangensis]
MSGTTHLERNRCASMVIRRPSSRSAPGSLKKSRSARSLRTAKKPSTTPCATLMSMFRTTPLAVTQPWTPRRLRTTASNADSRSSSFDLGGRLTAAFRFLCFPRYISVASGETYRQVMHTSRFRCLSCRPAIPVIGAPAKTWRNAAVPSLWRLVAPPFFATIRLNTKTARVDGPT